jgi:hypothetical protein
MRTLFTSFLLLGGLSVWAQHSPQAAITELFDAMRASDSARIKRVMHPQASLSSVGEQGGKLSVGTMPTNDFLGSIASMAKGLANEQVGRMDVRIDGDLAQAWVPYSFYLGDQFSHCGTNAFTLVKDQYDHWQILSVIDTRRTENCATRSDSLIIASLDKLMDAWHHAAATADEEVFFGTMSADGIYLGTDATERWLRDSMAVWAEPYFQRDVAWAFTPKERFWQLSDDGQTAWFDEHLDSWMGVVRGSGVLSLKPDGHTWELRHYNLAMAVPNEKMDAVRIAIDPTAKKRE